MWFSREGNKMNRCWLFEISSVLILSLTWSAVLAAQSDDAHGELLLEAVQKDDLESVQEALAAGADVNFSNRYGATPLSFACDRANVDMVRMLLKRGANPNVKDSFYNATPLTWAQSRKNQEIILLLLANGAEGGDAILRRAVAVGQVDYAAQIIETGAVSSRELSRALATAEEKELDKLVALLKQMDVAPPEKLVVDPDVLKRYEGDYQSDRITIQIEVRKDQLMCGFNDAAKSPLVPVSSTDFELGTSLIRFEVEQGQVEGVRLTMGGREINAARIDAAGDGGPSVPAAPETDPPVNFEASSARSLAADRAISSCHWPSFRGSGARGVAEGQKPPISWDATSNNGYRWRTPIPGLGLSSPCIHDDRIYLTSAVNPAAEAKLKIGLYGNVDSVQEDHVYDFNVYCIDKNNGNRLWKQTAISARPAVKRHAKSSHANPTVATDGEHVVAFFGSEGLYCYDRDGGLLWQKSLGVLDSGWFYDAGYQWGFGASPIIYDGRVIVQCDIQKGSFIASYDLRSGEENWRVDRDEIPTWSSPTIHEFGELPMLLTQGRNAARGYDARTGELLWSLSGHSEIVVPTPFVAHDLIFVASGYSPIQPIYAIRPDARGDVSLSENASSSPYVSWSKQRGGPYMPTPIVYGDYLYTCANNGILTCYQATTGVQVYKKRVRIQGVGGASFTASPLAGDGHLYLTAETGHVVVVQAGPKFKIVATNPCGEPTLATPAISDGAIYLRTQDSLIAVFRENEDR